MATYEPKDPVDTGIWGWFLLLLLPVWLPFYVIAQWRRESFFDRTLEEQKRILHWKDLLERTKDTPGSIIIEVGNKRPSRFWWCNESILSLSPITPSKLADLNLFAYGGANQHPFQKWCYDTYLSLDSGSALLIEDALWEADVETSPFADDFERQIQERFPNQDIIVVTYYDLRYA